MIKDLLLIYFLLFSNIIVFGQQGESRDYHPPLKIPLILSSNFGELRPNHFHMGIDFKTQGKIGFNLYSIESGYVSRIKVSPYGYGKVIYIDHPNGITSVYAHCHEFRGAIDSIVKATQIKEENFEVEIFPMKNKIRVEKGQIIGISGNTGSSSAPHLHFELRDTKTEHALNPLVYGFDIADNKKPEIRGVKIYGITNRGYIFEQKELQRTVSKGKDGYQVANNSITIPSDFLSRSGGLGLSFDVIDRLSDANNQCGLYGSYLIVNGDTVFGQRTDRIPFESTRYVNSHKDHAEYSTNKKKFHKSFRTSENDLPIYFNDDIGHIEAKPGETLKVQYSAFDAKGNTSTLHFDLHITEGTINSKDRIVEDLTYLKPNQSMRVKKGNTEVEFGITTVYEPLKINDNQIESKIGDANIPVHKAYRISITSNDRQDGKHYIEMTTANGKRRALKIQYHNNEITCESKYFGSYRLMRDTIAPIINLYNSSSTLLWKISDQGIGIDDYDLFIDGKWQLVEYDYKSGLITYERNKFLIGEKEVVVRVRDACGNTKEWKKVMLLK